MRRFALLLAIAVTGCIGDDGGSLTAAGLPDALKGAFCRYYVRCGLIHDMATCRDLELDVEFDPETLAAVNNGTVLFDEAAASECLAAIGGISCAEDMLGRVDTDACGRAFTGTVADGGVCSIDEQCISQQCNVTPCPDACCQGTCIGSTPPPPSPRLGESCAANSNCLGSFCDPLTTVCTAYLTTGQPCESGRQCLSAQCNGTCYELPAPGAACVDSDGEECRDIGNYCSPASMTCVPYALQGDSCDATTVCSPAYRCIGGTCQLRPTLGESCAQASCIDNSYCDDTTMLCTAPKPDGQPCQGGDECQGDCDFDTMTCVTDPVCI